MRRIVGIVVHRSEAGFTGEQVNEREYPNSYHYFIRADGTVDRMLPVPVVAKHALSWNASTIGIALYGDFDPRDRSRNMTPTPYQLQSLVELCVSLRAEYGTQLWIKGHTDLPGATKYSDKRCPGPNLNLDDVCRKVLHIEEERMCVDITDEKEQSRQFRAPSLASNQANPSAVSKVSG